MIFLVSKQKFYAETKKPLLENADQKDRSSGSGFIIHVLECKEFLMGILCDQSSVFPEIGLTCWSECTANSIFRKNIADLVEFFRCAVGLMKNQLINVIFSLTVENVITVKEPVHTMSSSDHIIQSGECIQTDKSY